MNLEKTCSKNDVHLKWSLDSAVGWNDLLSLRMVFDNFLKVVYNNSTNDVCVYVRLVVITHIPHPPFRERLIFTNGPNGVSFQATLYRGGLEWQAIHWPMWPTTTRWWAI